jgi:hypothetical protein
LTGRRGKAARPPKDEPWVWLTRQLLASPAWRSLSVNARRLVDRLCIEHMAHAGQDNGRLIVTHKQFAKAGVLRDGVAEAIAELEALGLLRCERGGRHRSSRYLLTFLPTHDYEPPPNDWRRVTMEHVEQWQAERRERRRTKRQKTRNVAPESRGILPPKVGATEAALPPKAGAVATPDSRSPFYISGSSATEELAADADPWAFPAFLDRRRR